MELFEIGLVDDMENLQATLLVTVTPTLASSGQTVGTICIGQDITKLKDGPRALGWAELVGGLEHFLFFHILGIIIPTD